MKGVFDVDCGDVVSEEHYFVGMDLMLVFVFKLPRYNQAALQESGDEGAGAGEGVENVDVFIGEGAAKLFFEQVVDGVNNEVNHLYRRVDDAELFDHAGEGGFEELVVEFNDDALFACGVVDTLGPHSDGVVKLLQGFGLFRDVTGFKQVEHLLHGERDGVILHEGVAFEERFKDRFGDDVLREHLNGLLLGNGGVDVLPKATKELLKGFLVLSVGLDKAIDSFGLPLGNLCNILRPLLPVAPVADLLYHAGKENALELLELHGDLFTHEFC